MSGLQLGAQRAMEMTNTKTLGHGGSVHLDDEEKEDKVVHLGEEVAKLTPVTLLFLKKIGLQYRFSSACTYIPPRWGVAVCLWFLRLYFLLDSLVCDWTGGRRRLRD